MPQSLTELPFLNGRETEPRKGVTELYKQVKVESLYTIAYTHTTSIPSPLKSHDVSM